MRKIFYITLAAFTLGIILFFYNQKTSIDLTYEEPKTNFIKKDKIPLGESVIYVMESKFVPSNITIKENERIFFVNMINKDVWPASNPHPDHEDYSAFDPKIPIKPGEAWGFKFKEVGIWQFHDHLDPAKRGSVKVIP